MKVFAGMYHDLLHEKDRHLVLDEARQFIFEAFRARARRRRWSTPTVTATLAMNTTA